MPKGVYERKSKDEPKVPKSETVEQLEAQEAEARAKLIHKLVISIANSTSTDEVSYGILGKVMQRLEGWGATPEEIQANYQHIKDTSEALWKKRSEAAAKRRQLRAMMSGQDVDNQLAKAGMGS